MKLAKSPWLARPPEPVKGKSVLSTASMAVLKKDETSGTTAHAMWFEPIGPTILPRVTHRGETMTHDYKTWTTWPI